MSYMPINEEFFCVFLYLCSCVSPDATDMLSVSVSYKLKLTHDTPTPTPSRVLMLVKGK